MGMYPAHTLRMVLSLPAVSFFSLLNEGYKRENRQFMADIRVATYPHMNKDDQKALLHQIEWANKEPGDILKQSDDYSGIAGVGKILGSK